MDATPISFDTAVPLGMPATQDAADIEPMLHKWAALQEAAALVAGLAGVVFRHEAGVPFPAALRDAPPWLRGLARQSVEDLAAIMEPGLSALITVHGRGGDTTAPARVLWDEFVTARDALVGMIQPLD